MSMARALAGHFAHVTVVERDPMQDAATSRRGVPQLLQLHALIMSGAEALDDLYGNYTQTLRDRGGASFDGLENNLTLDVDGWWPRVPSGLQQIGATRPLMEDVMRELTLASGNITVRRGAVRGLQSDSARTRVTGVLIADEESGTEAGLAADLVVDCSGRGTRAPRWIEEMGYQPPEQSIVVPYLGYATVHCHLPDDLYPIAGSVWQVDVGPKSGLSTRGAGVMPEENGLVGIVAIGHARDYPPGDADALTEWLRGCLSPIISQIWACAEKVSEIRTTRTSVNRLNRWHELERAPLGLLASGDALAAYNPTWGQGIASAAMQARLLRDMLCDSDDLDDVMRRFPAEAFEVIRFAWDTATQGDLEWDHTEAENFPREEESAEDKQYYRILQRLAIDDPELAAMFLRSYHYIRPDLLDTQELRERARQAGDLKLGFADPPRLPDDIARALEIKPAAR
jgi:flavin-dependent dehydrogenase